MKRCAARQGPRVWELDGPTPILNMSKTEMDSCGKYNDFGKDNEKGPDPILSTFTPMRKSSNLSAQGR